MNGKPLQQLQQFLKDQYSKPEALFFLSCGACVLMLVWTLFVSPQPQAAPGLAASGVIDRKLDAEVTEVLLAEAPVTEVVATEPVELLLQADTLMSPAPPDPLPEMTPETLPQVQAYVAIILDDIGNNSALGMQAVSLPGAVTYAVLPHTPFGEKLARKANELGKEVMLHAPMSNLAQRPLGEGGLTPLLSEQEFSQSLLRSIASIPFVEGVNNHMGSELTEARLQMQWLMRELRKQDLYFVDSLTTARSVAAQTASEYGVPNLRRHVFLDNQTTFENIDFEFRRMIAIARSEGMAVAIGHPYKETLDYLQSALPSLEAQGVRLITVSDMLALNAPPVPFVGPAPELSSAAAPDS